MEQMPMIVSCTGSDCSYNKDMICNAMAVTIGEEGEAICDTYYHGSRRIAYPETVSFVGACKMESCRFNRYLECTAYWGVSLVGREGRVYCDTCEAAAGSQRSA
ncbi:MAG: DUF1540 domain-containing protein [bacterium]|nr:DUF1540 domain-containing protein [bacterium]